VGWEGALSAAAATARAAAEDRLMSVQPRTRRPLPAPDGGLATHRPRIRDGDVNFCRSGAATAIAAREGLPFSGQILTGEFRRVLIDRSLLGSVATTAPRFGAPEAVELTAGMPVSSIANDQLVEAIDCVVRDVLTIPHAVQSPLVAAAVARHLAASNAGGLPEYGAAGARSPPGGASSMLDDLRSTTGRCTARVRTPHCAVRNSSLVTSRQGAPPSRWPASPKERLSAMRLPTFVPMTARGGCGPCNSRLGRPSHEGCCRRLRGSLSGTPGTPDNDRAEQQRRRPSWTPLVSPAQPRYRRSLILGARR